MERSEIRKDIHENEVSQQQPETLRAVVNNPVYRSIYVNKKDEDKPTHWSDRLKCKDCGGTYMRSCVSGHKKTKVHQAYESMNSKIRDLLAPKDD
jgi:hypothetical protein